MAKAKVSADEKFDKIDFDLFEALAALDKKDYGYYDRLTEEQQQKFNPFMLIKWLTYIKGKTEAQQYYILAGNEFGNKYMFNELVGKHPKLQWLMLCASSPNIGKQVTVHGLRGEHSVYGRIWLCAGKDLVTEYGAKGNHAEFAQSWLQKLPPEPLHEQYQVEELKAA